MKKYLFIVTMVAISMGLILKFVETKNLKKSDVFGSANFYTDNRSFVDSSTGYNVSKFNWFGEFYQMAGGATVSVVEAVTNNQLVVAGITGATLNLVATYIAGSGGISRTETNINYNQNVAIAALD